MGEGGFSVYTYIWIVSLIKNTDIERIDTYIELTAFSSSAELADFGYYGCAVANRLGKQEVAILMDRIGKYS